VQRTLQSPSNRKALREQGSPLMERAGIEPATSSLQSWRSPN
jgi:hypothetical protein